MAATHKLVQQAMSGQWQEVPKTVEQRRLLLDQLSASATPQDQQWLSALQQAMAESDVVVSKISQAGALNPALPHVTGEGYNKGAAGDTTSAAGAVDLVTSTIEMIRMRGSV